MKFSVVIPLYNKEKQIANTLRTVLAQTYQDFEIVIVNDGSTDGSVDEVKKISDPRIRIINQANEGVSFARNRGIREAKAPYIALLDADDLWMPEFLAKMSSLIDKYPECNVFASRYNHISKGKTTDIVINKMPFSSTEGILSNYFEVAACSEPPIWTSATVISKEAMLSIGLFPKNIKSGEDLLTWARLAARYKIAYINSVNASFIAESYDVSERPKRLPQVPDVVVAELLKLAKEFNPPHINKYICEWHKMRSNIYMRLRMRKQSIREALTAIRYNPTKLKLWAYIAVNLLPAKLQPF